jgi:hypothetical protein
MCYAAFFGSDSLLDRAADGVGEGGELIGIVLLLIVVVVALPITAFLRAFSSRVPQ